MNAPHSHAAVMAAPPSILPPYSREAEQAVLGAVLAVNTAFDALQADLADADFFSHDHRMIWRALSACLATGKPADAITVAEWLKDRGELEPVGFDYLLSLADVGSTANVAHYAAIVRDKSIRRAIYAAACSMSDLALSDSTGMSVRVMLDKAAAMLASVDERSARGQGTFRRIGEVIGEVVASIDEAKKANASTGLSSGFLALDGTMNPMMPGQLVVIGARPAVGKTSLAVNIATHAATALRQVVGMFSMEMTDVEIAVRILSGESGVPAGRFREHRFGDREWAALNPVMSAMHEAPFYIDHSGGLSIQDLTARARLAARQVGGFGLLIVDYVQLSRSEGRYDNRAVEIGAVTSGLKRLAKELRCPVIALSQLNREAAKENKRPTIAELRDSGSIEADADTILLLHRPFVMNQNRDVEFDAEIIVGKQRNGGIGTVHLDYDARLTKFFEPGKAPGRKE